MSVVAKINPLTYGVDAFRQIVLSNQVSQNVLERLAINSVFVDTLFLIGFSVVMVSVAVIAFNKKA